MPVPETQTLETAVTPRETFGVYVHIPFCRKKCHYCDFVCFSGKEEQIPEYLNALCRETAVRAGAVAQPVTSIFFGGGTPSVIGPAGIEFVSTVLREHFPFSPGMEWTVEVNPESATPAFLMKCLEVGVNRISIGVQSLNPQILKSLGRIHSVQNAREAFLTASGLGFENISVDLMYGLAAQTEEDWLQGLREILTWEPSHLSMYALTVAPGTAFYQMHQDGRLALPIEDSVVEMYYRGADILGEAGYYQYEISNFAKPGRASVHNCTYWDCGPYMGLGLAAHSYFGGARFRNTSVFNEYLRILNGGGPVEALVRDREAMTPARMAEDALIFGLRQNRGIDIEAYDTRFNTSLLHKHRASIENLTRAGLLEIESGFLRLSSKGLMLSNCVFREFISLPGTPV